MNGEAVLFDSNVIIYLSKRELPLAFIATTADCKNLTLVTRNTNDFKKLGLALIDPFL